jgi:hypothetical protein
MCRTTAGWRSLAVAIAAILALAALEGTAFAALPGANGRIAFMSTQDGDYDVYTVDSNGGTLAQLTNNPATDGDPGWSADGTAIAFASDRDGNFEIYKMNADGTGQTRLTNNGVADEYPAWSPDGTKIAYQSATPNTEILKMNTDGSGQVNLTNNAANDTTPNWSPDGTKIVWTSYRTGNGDVYKMNADGSSVTVIESTAALTNSPAWSPQGDFLLGALQLSGNYDIVKGDPNAVNSATPLYAGAGQDESPDWQPLNSSYARPSAATPMSIPLVPAYKECTTPQTTHRAINLPSCYAPKPESNHLTVGTNDFNGAAANSTGKVRINVFCNGGAAGELPPCLTTSGDQLDGKVTVSLTDVRCQGVSGGCAGALADYTGELYLFAGFRVTDKNNGPTGVGPSGNATVTDLNVDFSVPCAGTLSGSVGSTCSVTTSIDSVLGTSTAIAEQKRGIWELVSNSPSDIRSIRLHDGGANGVFNITDPVFAVGGLFFP